MFASNSDMSSVNQALSVKKLFTVKTVEISFKISSVFASSKNLLSESCLSKIFRQYIEF